MPQQPDMAEMVYQSLRQEIKGLTDTVNQLRSNTERAEFTDGIPAYLFVDLPTDGLADGTAYITLAWVTNARKSGEGAGLGTGVLAIYQDSSGTWKRVGDYTDVTT